LYRSDYLNTSISELDAKNVTLKELLSLAFDKSDITYKILEDKLVVITPKTLTSALQQQKISGTVIDATSNEPIIGANVVVEGTTIGAVTDANGKFSLDIPKADAVLVVSFLGFNSERVSISGQSNIEVKLIPDVKNVGEVVVVGYGVQKKEALTGAITAIKGKEMEKGKTTNLSNSFAGRISGVVASTASGEPGSDASRLLIRGQSTNGDNSPLIVVDGVANRLGGLERIDANDIESISV